MKTLANRASKGGRTFERTMGLKKTQGLKDQPSYKKNKNLVFTRFQAFIDGGRDWTRTSDPYRVKVVL